MKCIVTDIMQLYAVPVMYYWLDFSNIAASGKIVNVNKLSNNFFSLTRRLHVPIVGPTGRSDWSVRPVGPTIVPC